MINEYEKILISKRGYISSLPKNNKAVIIVSGGLDSIVTSARLIQDFDLELFPLHIVRGQRNGEAERKSIQYFYNYYKKKYPGKFHRPKIIRISIPPKEIKNDLKNYMKLLGHPLRDPMLYNIGVQYAISLNMTTSNDIKHIYSAAVPDDPFPHCGLTSLRSTNINICQNLNDWSWVISSPNIDKNLISQEFFKIQEIKWANINHIPLERTISCYDSNKKINFAHCGVCLACKRRKEAFKLAKIKDKTNYLN